MEQKDTIVQNGPITTTGGEIILYQPDSSIRLEVWMQEETVWLTQAQMTQLFQTTKQNISLHIGNIFKEGELNKTSVVKDFLTTAADGKDCAADIGETRGRCIGGDCHKARRGNAKTRPRTPQSAIPTRRNPGVRALPRPLSHHRRHCLSPRRIPQGFGQENVCVQSDGGGGGRDSDNFVEKRTITVSSE